MDDSFSIPKGKVVLRKAEVSEEAAVLGLMREAALWLQEKGIPQWRRVLTEKGEELVHWRVQQGMAYLAFLDGEPVGTLSIQWEDDFSWGERGLDGSAGYIHGFALSRRFAGKGVGRDILNWAVEFIRGRKSLVRLDCMAENPRLCRYYEEAGFSRVGTRNYPWGFKVVLYERA